MEKLNPSDWFRERLQQWQEDLQAWHVKHVEFKDPTKKAAQQVMSTTMSKAKGPAPGLPPKASPAEKPEENGKPKQDSAEDAEDDLEKDEDQDLFALDDICDMKDGKGTPLFSNFAFEDWALLSLRFELHLLVHAVKKDSGKEGIPTEDVKNCYMKYLKKSLNPKNYGVESVEEVLALVKDTAIIGARTKIVEPMVTEELAFNDIFVRLTEESRRDRQRRLDAGDVSAELKFPRPTPGSQNPGGITHMPGPGVLPNMPKNPMPTSPVAAGLGSSKGAPPLPPPLGSMSAPPPFTKGGGTPGTPAFSKANQFFAEQSDKGFGGKGYGKGDPTAQFGMMGVAKSKAPAPDQWAQDQWGAWKAKAPAPEFGGTSKAGGGPPPFSAPGGAFAKQSLQGGAPPEGWAKGGHRPAAPKLGVPGMMNASDGQWGQAQQVDNSGQWSDKGSGWGDKNQSWSDRNNSWSDKGDKGQWSDNNDKGQWSDKGDKKDWSDKSGKWDDDKSNSWKSWSKW